MSDRRIFLSHIISDEPVVPRFTLSELEGHLNRTLPAFYGPKQRFEIFELCWDELTTQARAGRHSAIVHLLNIAKHRRPDLFTYWLNYKESEYAYE